MLSTSVFPKGGQSNPSMLLFQIAIELTKFLSKKKAYIIYCKSGNRSEKASLIMKSLGFKVIYHYKKGYQDWIGD